MAKKWKPIEPMNKKLFEQLGLSTDPKDIRTEKKAKSVTQEEIERRGKVKADAIKAIEDGP